MPSQIIRMANVADEAYELDARYGRKRQFYSRETAEEMARVDNLIEAAGIVPGDSIEIFWKVLAANKKTGQAEMLEVWEISDLAFSEVDNGRFGFQDSEGKHVGAISLAFILDVRKVLPMPADG